MIHSKNKWRTLFIILLVFIFSFPGFILADEGYKIVSFKGKVKVKKNDEVNQLEKQLHVYLKKGDAVMAYPGATIEMVFPDGKNKTFTGPFYATVETLEKPFPEDILSFFEEPTRWKAIERIFAEEGEESVGNTKGTQEDSLNFYNEINQGVTEVKIENKTLTPTKEKEMKEILKMVESGFNAFPEEKQILVQALVYKAFGSYKTALHMIFSHYQGILYKKGKQPERELFEDYLFNEFLPIFITILPDNENKLCKCKFNSNFKLWWAAFYFDGTDLISLGKTIQYSLYPQNDYKIKANSTIQADSKSKGMDKAKSRCLFIVACADWTELEKFDNIETAKKELLENSIKETRSKTILDYGKVIIKLYL